MITIAAESETTTDNRVQQAFIPVEPPHEQLARIGDLLEAGELHPVVDAVLPLVQASAAYTGDVRQRRGRGKLSRSSQHTRSRRQGRVRVRPSNFHMPLPPDQGLQHYLENTTGRSRGMRDHTDVSTVSPSPAALSPWWRHAVILTMIGGFTVLIWLSIQVYHDAPPIPAQVVSPAGDTIFTHADILAGQRLFLQYGLMENGSIWGHGPTWALIFRPPTCMPWPSTRVRRLPRNSTIAVSTR